ncbi:MAG: RNA 3'-phosphate cyclase [Candidatus Aenigmarchaeota archaeon]|nr:RNA 3'-phosphate cyclase [Candidatus Aenigmarchaeota archaeon]
MLSIDGSYGEGGGSIVRIAVALSAVTGKPCKIINIRAKRRNQGLRAQHSTAVNAVAKLCDAQVKGNEIGSTAIEFYPNEIRGGSLSLNVGTAGSAALVLQALMIPAMHCASQLDIKIIGGTLNKWAPSISYIQNATLDILKKMGYKGEVTLIRHGFYPKGGGEVEAKILPSVLAPLELVKRGKPVHVFGSCVASKDLEKAKVAERMQKYSRERLFKEFQVVPEIKAEYVDAHSTGGGMDLFVLYENSIIGSNSIAEPGKSAEKVAQEAITNLIENHASDAPIDEHMSDQIIPYMALARGESRVKVSKITAHTLTNIWVCEKFLDVKFDVNEEERIIKCNKN